MNLVNTLNYCAGTIGNDGVPDGIGNLVHLVFVIIQVVVPIFLIIWGLLDFAKAVMQQNEDDIKKGQKTFIKRLIAAVIAFLIVTITQLVINIVGNVTDSDDSTTSTSTVWTCAKEMINGTPGGR